MTPARASVARYCSVVLSTCLEPRGVLSLGPLTRVFLLPGPYYFAVASPSVGPSSRKCFARVLFVFRSSRDDTTRFLNASVPRVLSSTADRSSDPWRACLSLPPYSPLTHPSTPKHTRAKKYATKITLPHAMLAPPSCLHVQPLAPRGRSASASGLRNRNPRL